MSPRIQIHPDPASLSQAAAEHFISLAHNAISTRGRFAVALSGGSTPQPTFRRLASPELAPRVEWESVHVFWGDERCVPPDHPESNYGMAKGTLLDRVPIPPNQVHRMRGEVDPIQAAIEYEDLLRQYFQNVPRFDLVLLGMGTDGHVASLFPRSQALHETRRWVAAETVGSRETWRLTLTPLAINAARQVTFLVMGQEKAAILRDVLQGAAQPDQLPAQLVRPVSGHLLWLVDAHAASLPSRNPHTTGTNTSLRDNPGATKR